MVALDHSDFMNRAPLDAHHLFDQHLFDASNLTEP